MQAHPGSLVRPSPEPQPGHPPNYPKSSALGAAGFLRIPGETALGIGPRSAETDYATGSLSEFRGTSSAFVSGPRRSLTVEQNSDRHIGHRIWLPIGAVRTGKADKVERAESDRSGSDRPRRGVKGDWPLALRLTLGVPAGIPFESFGNPRGFGCGYLATSGGRPYPTAPLKPLPGVVPSHGEEVPDQSR